jgi:ribosomal protein S18 acetylase RimI-like enzyme
MNHHVCRLTNRDEIRAFLHQDRHLMAYALGDLDDAFWPESAFYGAYRKGSLESLLLMYNGLVPPVLTAFGMVEGVRAIFEAQTLPDEMYYLFLPETRDLLGEYYNLAHNKREWRMVLPPDAPMLSPQDDVVRLSPEHLDALTDLYRHAAEPGEEIVAFSPWQIGHGAFFGVWDIGALVAAAGTHVWSPSEKVVAIGNVFTRPENRGHGYATRCTAAVVQAARDSGLDTIVLNVRHDNAPAIHVYEKLGFRTYAEFLEGPALKWGTK